MTEAFGIIAPHPPIMVPEVGGAQSAVVSDTLAAMDRAAASLRAFAPETLVVMSPHAPLLADAFAYDTSDRLRGDLGGFGAPRTGIAAPGDPALAIEIARMASAEGLPMVSRDSDSRLAPGALDHGVVVPLRFLDPDGGIPLVVLSLSFLPLASHRMLGSAVRRAADALGRRVAFIASGDCSHRLTPDAPAGFHPRAAEFDARLRALLEADDYPALEHLDPTLIDAAGECGLRSFIALGGFLDGTGARTTLTSYEGPWGVGYLTAIASTPQASHEVVAGGASAPVRLAREAIEAYVRERRVIADPPAVGLLAERHGAFVSLHRSGSLRGCIGTIEPTQASLGAEIVRNAIQSATADPRFPPLTPDELADLEISVDVLQTPEPATLTDLDPRRYGVIVSADWRRGLLLPDLPGVETVAEQVDIARRKAGIGAGERVRLERFRVDRYR